MKTAKTCYTAEAAERISYLEDVLVALAGRGPMQGAALEAHDTEVELWRAELRASYATMEQLEKNAEALES